MRKQITCRGGAMPHYGTGDRKAHSDNSLPNHWYLRRVGWKGFRCWRRFWPWLSGDALELDFVIESDIEGEYEFRWVLLSRMPDMSERQVSQEFIPNIRVKRGKTIVHLNTYLFQYEDEYRLLTELNPIGQVQFNPSPARQTLLNFKVLATDVWYTDWEKGIGIGLIGAVVGLLFGLLIIA